MFVNVVISPNQRGIGNGLTYFMHGMRQNVIGCLVAVPFRGKTVEGIITDTFFGKPGGNFDVKNVTSIINTRPLVPPEQMGIAKWMSDYYMCDLRKVLSVFLPGKKWSKLACGTFKPKRRHAAALGNVRLTPRQMLVYKAIKSDPRPALISGMAFTSKTEIYASLVYDAIRNNKTAILLLPEIMLAENFIEKFRSFVSADDIAIVHSKLTPAQRRRAWQKCYLGQAKLAIGSRSALFVPLKNIGVVIIDEEHEWTYKNEQAPRYHAVTVAEQFQGKSRIVLGSSTPSVDSWHKTKTGAYQIIEPRCPHRIARPMAARIVDMAQVDCGKYYPLSPTLINAIHRRLIRKERIVLFFNRRGFSVSLTCMDCRYRFEDPTTHLPYTIHHNGSRSYLLSHHTGEKTEMPSKCPKCGSAVLREIGAGTQKIECILGDLFPHAKVLRVDADTLKSPEQIKNLPDSIKNGGADILLGTRAVIKEAALPNVTLVAVILADIGLSIPSFRAGEKVFQSLARLVRCSVGGTEAEVIIQTFRPDAPEIKFAASRNVRAYLEGELRNRKKFRYPPESQMARLVFSGRDAMAKAKKVKALLDKCVYGNTSEYCISCSPSVTAGGKKWHVFVRGKNIAKIIKNIPRDGFTVDLDPIECV